MIFSIGIGKNCFIRLQEDWSRLLRTNDKSERGSVRGLVDLRVVPIRMWFLKCILVFSMKSYLASKAQ